MKIDRLALGSYQTNTYILRENEQAADCVIIDTGMDSEHLPEFLRKNNLTPQAVILTHGHADHITGIPLLREKYPDMKVCIHKLDAPMLTDTERNLSALAGISFKTDPADVILEDNQEIEYAGIKLKVLHTPGHSPGGISLYNSEDGILFSGDALFADSIGRTDFPGSDTNQLITGIKEKILPLPEETKVCPGHGPATTIKQEKLYNQYLR